jgi:hypothetical protein
LTASAGCGGTAPLSMPVSGHSTGGGGGGGGGVGGGVGVALVGAAAGTGSAPEPHPVRTTASSRAAPRALLRCCTTVLLGRPEVVTLGTGGPRRRPTHHG